MMSVEGPGETLQKKVRPFLFSWLGLGVLSLLLSSVFPPGLGFCLVLLSPDFCSCLLSATLDMSSPEQPGTADGTGQAHPGFCTL